MAPERSRLLTTRQVADMLAVPVSTVRRLIRSGILSPVVRVTPHHTVVEEDVVADLILARREAGGYDRRGRIARMVQRQEVQE